MASPKGDGAEEHASGLPRQLTSGVPMLKVSSKKIKPVIVTLSPTTITWPSLKGGRGESSSPCWR